MAAGKALSRDVVNPTPDATGGTTAAGAVARPRAGTVRIVPQGSAESAGVQAFNERMLAGHAPTDFVLPDRPNEPGRDADPAIRWTKYVAVDDEGEVRGGFLLMQQRGWLGGQTVTVANYQAPVSEGILDKRFGMVGMHMLRYLERQFPLSFVVGMGAADRPLPRLLSAAGWRVVPVPFLFRIVRARRVLRQLRPLQQHRPLRIAARLAADSGAGWMAAQVLHARRLLAGGGALDVTRAPGWGEWADAVWDRARTQFAFAVARDRATLSQLYPLEDERYEAYVFRAQGEAVGWAVCVQTAMRDHAYFGDLKVATILDVVGGAEAAPGMIAALSRTLASSADLIVTNQSHAGWASAFRRAGYASAPSNYLLAMSKPLAAAIGPRTDQVHVTRGDGDGRIHLM